MSKEKITYFDTPALKINNNMTMGFILGVLGIMLFVFANIYLFWGSTTIVTSFSLYHWWLESIAWITGFGIIVHGIGLLFYGRARQIISSILFGIVILFGLFLILYIDYFRPDLMNSTIFNDEAQFLLFKMIIMILEMVMIIISLIGIFATRAYYSRNITLLNY